MSLPHHLLALTLVLAPTIGCDVEDADDKEVPTTPAPAEPAPPTNRPVPQPQVSPGGQPRQVVAATDRATAAGPAFAPSIG